MGFLAELNLTEICDLNRGPLLLSGKDNRFGGVYREMRGGTRLNWSRWGSRRSRHAFQNMFDVQLDALYRTALRCSGTSTEAEDLLQETALQAYVHFGRLRDKGAVRAWFFKILLRTHLNRTRARGRRLEVVASQIEEEAYEDALAAWRPAPTPEQILDRQRSRECLNAALDALSPSLRTVVWLIDVEGFKQREVARMLEISEGTVASRLFRAHQRLRERLIHSPEAGRRQEEQ